MAQVIRTAVRVEGIVQGVGFRPFVHSLATSLGLRGLVGNDVDGVFAEVEGPQAAVQEFLAALERDAPPLARIERVTVKPMEPDGAATFAIVASGSGGRPRALGSADSATCAAGCSPKKDGAAPTGQWMPLAGRRPLRCGRASTARTSRSRCWPRIWRRCGGYARSMPPRPTC